MRFLVLTTALLMGAALAASPIRAEAEFAWCAISGFGAPQDCSFTTLAQCRAAVQGLGTDCERNPRFKGPAPTTMPPQARRDGTKS